MRESSIYKGLFDIHVVDKLSYNRQYKIRRMILGKMKQLEQSHKTVMIMGGDTSNIRLYLKNAERNLTTITIAMFNKEIKMADGGYGDNTIWLN